MVLNRKDYEQLANMILDDPDGQFLFLYKDNEELDLDYNCETFGYQEDETGAYICTGVDFNVRRVHSYDMESGEDTTTDLDETRLYKEIEQMAGLSVKEYATYER